MSIKPQPRLRFFDHPDSYSVFPTPHVHKMLPVEHFVNKFAEENPSNPFHAMVGQEMAKRTLKRAAINAMMRWDHACVKNFLVTGPTSVGKTTIVRLFAKILRLPLVEISPKAFTKMDDVFKFIRQSIQSYKPAGMTNPNAVIELIPQQSERHFELPPCIIFIDEAHALHKGLQNELLKAIEAKDRRFCTEKGCIVKTDNVCWFFATTETGDLFGPLLNRFTEINLQPYTREQIAQIVSRNFPEWSAELCRAVAYYEGRVPRRAISFAQTLNEEIAQNPTVHWKFLIQNVAEENQVDEYGLHLRHLKILKLLRGKPVSKTRLAQHLQVSENELLRLIVPPIMMNTEDMPALITVCQQGFCLTAEGEAELAKRDEDLDV